MSEENPTILELAEREADPALANVPLHLHELTWAIARDAALERAAPSPPLALECED